MTSARGPHPIRLFTSIAALLAAALLAPPAPAAAPGKGAAARGGSSGVADARPFTSADLKGLAFRSIGPANMGGRVAALAYVPGSRTSFYVGFGIGGVFKTENLGVTFEPVFDAQPNLSIGALAVADGPAKPGDDGKGAIVWVGTGEGNNRNSSSWGDGVWRSTDAGATFTHVGLENTHDIPRIAVDPRSPDTLYVAALGHLWGANPERGIFKTTDGGKTWKQALKIDADTGACEVVIDPKNPDTIYAGMYARRRSPWSYSGYSDKAGLFRSDDAGATWKRLTRGLPSRTGRIGLAIFPKEPRTLYAVVESDLGGTGRDVTDNYSQSGGLFRSDDRGESWERRSPIAFRPFYFSRVAVDPENAERVYLPGWDLAISDDGGRTFRGSGSPKVHVDFHAILVNPLDPNQIVVGNDGGVYISHDRAKNWDFLDNIAAGQFYRIAVDMADPYHVAGGLQDNGSWLGPSETLFKAEQETPGGDGSDEGIVNADWRPIYGSDGFTVQFDPSDSNVMYATGQGADIARVRLDTQEMRLIKPTPREGQTAFRFNWNAPFFVSPHDPTVLYLGGNRVFKLTGKGDQWNAISADLSTNDPVKSATVGSNAETYGTVVSLAESPLAKGMLWAGTDDGRVHVTKNDGGAWADVTPKEAGGLYVARVTPSRHAADTAYVAVDGHRSDIFRPIILKTRDAGRTWTSVAGDLPDGEPVDVVIETFLNPDALYAGTEHGLFVTVDGGTHWVRMNGTSLPAVPVDDLVIHPRERDLVVATHGRSLYIMDDVTPIAQLTPETRARPLAVFAPMPATPRLYSGRGYGGGAGIFRAPNPPMGAAITYWLRDGNPDGVKIAVSDPSGAVIRELTGPGRPGLNRVTWDLQLDAKHRIPTVDERRFDQPAFVPAGEYGIKVTLPTGVPGQSEKAETKVKVLPAPDKRATAKASSP
ncbi:MAG TPA: hypothetical protein VMQ62_08740 [Dongiaceae bacterium]|nr:hypothetical protein [Dongiaceae bacterium]